MSKILIVEDEEAILQGLKMNMEIEGYEIAIAQDGEKALEVFEEFNPDLILLDLMIPGYSGFEVCRIVRKKNPGVYIIMLTAKIDEPSKVTGLEMGADDYVTKPFSILELLARVKAGLRRSQKAEPDPQENEQVLKIGPFIFDFKGYTVKKDGKDIDFSSRELQLLQYFSQKKGEVILREELLENIWGYTPDNMPTTRTIDNHLVKLRQKIEEDPSNPQFLKSIRGIGYKLDV
jgi:DNA-binding response OmpR family regulator